jgi:hypothetical protein
MPVYAVKDGVVGRVSVSPYGYGNALYLVHSDGYTSVYGHLSRFNSKIEEYLRSEQYRLKTFGIDLKIPDGLISFKKGEIVAWSGNTGSSGGPHLHFEIRKTISEMPQNPLFLIPGINDKSSPQISAIYIYPISSNSHVNKSKSKFRIETTTLHKVTYLKSQRPIEVFGGIGIGIQTNDDFNGAGIKCGVYCIEVFIDQKPSFSFKFDQLSFNLGRYINCHIDYEELIRKKLWIQRLWLLSGNKLDLYATNSEKGIVLVNDEKIHSVRIVVSDAYNNRSTLDFKIIGKPHEIPVAKEEFTKVFYPDQENHFDTADMKIHIPEGALYEKLKFNYRSKLSIPSTQLRIYSVHNQAVPIQKPYELSLKTNAVLPKYQSKVIIVSVSDSGQLINAGGVYNNMWVTTSVLTFGNFAVTIDSIPPIIKPKSIKENKILTNRTKIEFIITDNLSGIATYTGTIDGNWVLFEYDAKTNTLFYNIDRKRIKTGKTHTLRLTVGDERRNTAEYKASFFL